MKTLGAVLVAVFLVWGVESLRCPNCDPSQCPDVSSLTCKRGLMNDVCRCCQVCRKIIGEECNGPWGIYGACGFSLVCVKPYPPNPADDDSTYELFGKGICRQLI